jgi:hypothetical protein
LLGKGAKGGKKGGGMGDMATGGRKKWKMGEERKLMCSY